MTNRTIARMKVFIPGALALTGTMLLAIGIGMVYGPAGVIAGGLGCWWLEWRFSDGT